MLKSVLLTEPAAASQTNSLVPASLDQVLARGLAKDPSARFGSAAELVVASRAALGQPVAPTTAVAPVTPVDSVAGLDQAGVATQLRPEAGRATW